MVQGGQARSPNASPSPNSQTGRPTMRAGGRGHAAGCTVAFVDERVRSRRALGSHGCAPRSSPLSPLRGALVLAALCLPRMSAALSTKSCAVLGWPFGNSSAFPYVCSRSDTGALFAEIKGDDYLGQLPAPPCPGTREYARPRSGSQSGHKSAQFKAAHACAARLTSPAVPFLAAHCAPPSVGTARTTPMTTASRLGRACARWTSCSQACSRMAGVTVWTTTSRGQARRAKGWHTAV